MAAVEIVSLSVGAMMLTCGGAKIFSVTEAESLLPDEFVTV
jgi:hypothetical protein